MGSDYVTTDNGTQIFFKDWGPKGAQPIVFHHGWPLSADDWDNQMLFFLHHGYRVIAHVYPLFWEERSKPGDRAPHVDP